MITKNKRGNQRSRVAFMGKKAAMEMSVGTIVTIVLLMSVLVLGIFLVQKIFSGSNDAINSVNDQLNSQINQLFSDSSEDLIIFPSSGKVVVKKGSDPSGAAFSYRNPEKETKTFVYTIEASDTFDYTEKCGSSMTKEIADKYIDQKSSKITLKGSQVSRAQKIFFETPKNAVSCTLIYRITIKDESGEFYDESDLRVILK